MSSQIRGFPSAFSWGCQAPWCLTTPPPKPLPPLHRSSWPPSSVKLSMMESITSTFQKFSKQPLKSWVWKFPKYHQKNTFVSQNSPRKIQGLAWRTHCGTKAQDSSEGCPCGTWSYQQGSLSINWSCLPLPLGGNDTCGDVGTIDEENRILMAHIFRNGNERWFQTRWKIDEDMETELSVGFVEDGRMFFRIVILFFVKVSHACIIFILTSTH